MNIVQTWNTRWNISYNDSIREKKLYKVERNQQFSVRTSTWYYIVPYSTIKYSALYSTLQYSILHYCRLWWPRMVTSRRREDDAPTRYEHLESLKHIVWGVGRLGQRDCQSRDQLSTNHKPTITPRDQLSTNHKLTITSRDGISAF